MEKVAVEAIITKIMKRDYDRWIDYKDSNVGCSFYVWKEQKGYMQKDIVDVTELLSD